MNKGGFDRATLLQRAQKSAAPPIALSAAVLQGEGRGGYRHGENGQVDIIMAILSQGNIVGEYGSRG